MKPIDRFYFDKEEPIKGCLLALKEIITSYHPVLKPRWYYGYPCFMYHKHIFCYLWIDKKTQFPYLAIGKGNKINHPALVQTKNTYSKKLLIDPKKDIPVETIHNIFDMAKELYMKK